MEKTYKDYEFCKDVECPIYFFVKDDPKFKQICRKHCVRSAKEFHKWLKKNKYKIIKDEDC